MDAMTRLHLSTEEGETRYVSKKSAESLDIETREIKKKSETSDLFALMKQSECSAARKQATEY